MNSPVLVAILVFVVSAATSQLHMIYTADRIAMAMGGYLVSLGLLPIVIGGSIGLTGVFAMGRKLKQTWWILAFGAIAALLPVLIVSWAMSRPEL